MKKITLIAAVGKNLELGRDNDLIWKIKEDLNFFKEMTMGKYVVMGLNTFYSLPKLLPGRKHIVITSKDMFIDDVIIIHSIEELLKYIEELNSEVMIIGGASIYKQMIDYADKMILTEIDDEANASVYYPKFDVNDWDKEIISKHNYNDIEYSHVIYTRKSGN